MLFNFFRKNTVALVLLAFFSLYAQNFQEEDSIVVFEDHILKTLFENDGSIYEKYGFEDLSGQESTDWMINAVSVYSELYAIADDQDFASGYRLIQDKVKQSIQGNILTSVEQGSPDHIRFLRYHYHADKYLRSKAKLISDLSSKGHDDNKYYNGLLAAFRSDLQGYRRPTPLTEEERNYTRAKRNQRWNLIEAGAVRVEKQNTAEYFYYQALKNILQSHATLLVLIWDKETDPNFNHYLKNIGNLVGQKFCIDPENNRQRVDGEPYNEEDVRKCLSVANYVGDIVAHEYNNWTLDITPRQKAMQVISMGLMRAQSNLNQIRNNFSISADSLEYKKYFSSYMSAASGPGLVLFDDNMENIVGKLIMPEEVRDRYHEHLIYESNKPQFKEHDAAMKAALKAATRKIWAEYKSLSDTYYASISRNPDKIVTYVVKYHSAAAAQVWNKSPNFVYDISDALDNIIREDKRSQTRKNVLMWGGLVVLGILILTGVGGAVVSILLAGTKLAATLLAVSQLMGTIGLFVGLADVGISTYELVDRTVEHKHYKAGLLSGNQADPAVVRASYSNMIEARIATALAVGGTVFEISTMKKLIQGAQAANQVGDAVLSNAKNVTRSLDDLINSGISETAQKMLRQWKSVDASSSTLMLHNMELDELELLGRLLNDNRTVNFMNQLMKKVENPNNWSEKVYAANNLKNMLHRLAPDLIDESDDIVITFNKLCHNIYTSVDDATFANIAGVSHSGVLNVLARSDLANLRQSSEALLQRMGIDDYIVEPNHFLAKADKEALYARYGKETVDLALEQAVVFKVSPNSVPDNLTNVHFRAPAMQHADISRKIAKMEKHGASLYLDPSLPVDGAMHSTVSGFNMERGLYSEWRILLHPEGEFHLFAHEYQHFEFHVATHEILDELMGRTNNVPEIVTFSSNFDTFAKQIASASSDSLEAIQRKYPDFYQTLLEANVLYRQSDNSLGTLAINETLSTRRQIQLIDGYRVFSPEYYNSRTYGLRFQITDWDQMIRNGHTFTAAQRKYYAKVLAEYIILETVDRIIQSPSLIFKPFVFFTANTAVITYGNKFIELPYEKVTIQ
ncbi:hypothetical protein MRY82_03095 [bacterium]|nr:hypothetical protein [bacterium]